MISPWLRLRRDVTLTSVLALRHDVTVASEAINPYSYVDLTSNFSHLIALLFLRLPMRNANSPIVKVKQVRTEYFRECFADGA